MKKIHQYLLVGGSLAGVMLLLSGCANGTNQKQLPTGLFGFVYHLIGLPLQHIMLQMAHAIGNNGAGWAIVIVTIMVRIILMPLMLNQQNKSITQQEKIARLQPQMKLIQAAMRQKDINRDQQMQLSMWQRDLYQKNNLSLTGGIGCLPLLLPLPVMWGIYDSVFYSKALSAASFFGISLSQKSLSLAIVATVFTLAQSYLSTIGIPAEQKKTMQSMLLLNPVMTLFFSLSFPGSVALYWTAANFVLMLQQLIITFVLMPRVKARIAKELKDTPVVEVVTSEKIAALFNGLTKNQNNQTNTNLHNNIRNRNQGKQRHHK
ncbi:MAG: membrane protein insertase YidC [Lactobacillus sp.]